MRLEQLLRRVEGRADAEAGDAGMLAAVVERHAHRIDAVRGPLIVAERRGWRSDSRARARAGRRAGPRLRSRSRGSAGASRVPVSPAISASRIRPEEIALAVEHDRRDGLGGDAMRRRRASCSSSTLPLRPLPKVKSSPVTTPAAPICSASTSATKSSASGRAQAPRRTRTPAWRRRRRGRTAARAGRGWSGGTAARRA